MTIPICPHCGKSNTTLVKGRAYSWLEGSFDEEGYCAEWGNDGLTIQPSCTVRCDYGGCFKIRRDLTVVGGRVVQKHG